MRNVSLILLALPRIAKRSIFVDVTTSGESLVIWHNKRFRKAHLEQQTELVSIIAAPSQHQICPSNLQFYCLLTTTRYPVTFDSGVMYILMKRSLAIKNFQNAPPGTAKVNKKSKGWIVKCDATLPDLKIKPIGRSSVITISGRRLRLRTQNSGTCKFFSVHLFVMWN